MTAAESATGSQVWRLRALCLGIAVVGLGLDLATKQLALANLDPARPIPLLGGVVTLQLIRNPGAAFSMGESFTVVISIVGIIALVGVLFWFLPKLRHTGWAVAIGLLLAGILGNLSDRLFREPGPLRGHVVDFIQLPYFAIVNVADICITAAAVMIIWLTVITKVSPAGVRLEDRDDAGDE
ncbi:MAG: signal peptidase II [Propionibacteriaceae bacterium]|nr:signal peptidase II [Propionibacteriaceae bacterium]